MEKSPLYTRTGDKGYTALVGGERVKKDSVRLDAYGTLDEFSSFLGVVESHPNCPAEDRKVLLTIQNKLFNIGCYLATASTEEAPATLYGLTVDDIAVIENRIDVLDSETPKMRAFVLPGGSPLAAHTHVARTVCRRAERRIYALADTAPVDELLLRYINRLSDLLFIMARHFNHNEGVAEITWNKDA